MKKALLQSAALACAVSCSTVASAQEVVTIYGLIDASVSYADDVSGSSSHTLDNGAWQSSRLGFRGVENLGGGLKAIFTLEAGLNVDTGSTSAAFFGRQSFVGLSGEMGTLTLGRQYDFIYYLADGRLVAGGLESAVAGGPSGVAGAVGPLDLHAGGVRYDNSVKWTKNFGGLGVGLMYGLGREKAVPVGTSRAISATLTYRNGGFDGGFAWVKDNYDAANSGNAANEVFVAKATTAMDRPAIEQGSADLYAVAKEVVEARKNDLQDPEEDLISALLLAKINGEAMPVQLVVASIRQFLSAAQAAPQAVLGSIAVHLARDQALQEQLRQDPSLHPKAVEEFLRMYAPYRVFARMATKDVEIRGRSINAGEVLTMMFPSANRDEDVFSNPHEFRLDRGANKHIAFGRGAHQCPAASLARTELTIGLGKLLDKTSRFKLAGPVKMSDWLEFGPSSTPIRVEPARAKG
ncbi:porin [Comamonas thiooxydans]|uniref:porin n=1 Tax=Comamonas thiooxydans TaxID=363952 RepID=UPI000A529D76|nr:porin [Comamonas thiooxydans]